MPKNADSLGKGLRFCSALLAVLSSSTTVGGVAVLAEEANPIAAVEEEAPLTDSEDVFSVMETGGEETPADGSIEEKPNETTDAADGSEPDTVSDTAADTESNAASDADNNSSTETDGAENTNSGLSASVEVGEDGSVNGTLSDGASISIAADGSAILDLSGVERGDTQAMEDGVGYTDPTTGATVYRMEDFLGDEDEPVDYVDDTDAFMAWMDAPTMTAEELSAAMEEANAYDQAVLQNCYEPVENDVAVQSAEQPIVLDGTDEEETTESALQETSPGVTYRLKDEYAAPVQADDTITFTTNNDVAPLSLDGYQAESQSATIIVVDSSALYLRIVDQDGNGITGASVTYSLSNTENEKTLKHAMTQTMVNADGTPGSEGMLKLDTNALTTDTASLFLNVSREGYYGITRMADIVEIGNVLTYTLCKHSDNVSGLYLRGSYIDGVDTKDGYTLMMTAKNKNNYDITAIVGVAGSVGMETFPDTLTMSTVNKTNPGYPQKTFTSGTVKKTADYALYNFTDTWSHYDDNLNNATLRNGDALYLNQVGTSSWITLEKDKDDSTKTNEKLDNTISMGIETELPDLDRIGFAKDISFGLLGSEGINVNLSDDFLGGDSTLSSDLLSIPVFFYISLQGSVLLGFGPVLNLAETEWLQDDKNNPQSQNPSAQAKTETLISRIKTETIESFNVKKKYSDKQEKRANLSDKIKDAKKNDKKVMSTAGGSIDWTGAVFLFGTINRRNYRITANLGVSMHWTGTVQYTGYLVVGPVPFYAGVEASTTGGGTAIVGIQTTNITDASKYGLSENASLTLDAAIMLEVVIGAGLRGIMGLEGFANANIGGFMRMQNTTAQKGHSPVRFQFNAGVNAGLRARFFFVTYTKSWTLIDEILYDSWGLYDDPITPDTPSPAALTSGRPVVVGDTDELPQYSVLLADPEVRAAAADASNQEYGVYAESLDGIEPEVSIAEDGTQEDLRANEPMLLEDETAGQSAVTGISTMEKSKVLTGSDFQYVAYNDETYLFRIATVYDRQMGGNVARVVYSKGDKDGQSSQTTALPSTREYRTYYGYDTNFAVSISANERNIAYVAIVSAPSADTSDIAKQARDSRLRVLRVNLESGKIEGNILVEKAKLNGSTDYAYTGTPAVFGCYEGNAYTLRDDIGSYMVACAVTTDVEKLANGTLTRGNDAIAIATNRNGQRHIINNGESIVWQDGIRRTNLTFTNLRINSTTHGGWGLVTVDLDQPQTMDILDINYHMGAFLEVEPNTRLSVTEGTISNLQHPSQSYRNEVYFTCNGNLYTLEHSNNRYKGFKQLTDKTDVGDDVVLPAGDGVTLLGKSGDDTQNMLAVFTTARGREATGSDGKKQTVTDTVVRVYTLLAKDGGGYTVSGPRESVIENRSPVKTAAVGIATGRGSDNLVRVMYLANQNFIQTSQPSGSIADGSYRAGTAQDTSDMYMWELRPGKAAELAGFVPKTTSILRKKTTTADFDINIHNVGGYTIKNVTIEVREGSKDGILVGQYVVNIKDAGYEMLGPGSDLNTTLQIPLKESWNGSVTLYAAIVKADGEEMSSDYTPVWIGENQLIEERKVTMSVSQTSTGVSITREINGKTYTFGNTFATVRIRRDSSVRTNNIKLRITEMRFDKDGKESWLTDTPREINLQSYPTDAETRIMTIGFDMREYWQAGDTAVKFEVLGDNDITLNCLYTSGQILLSPAVAEERGQDSTIGYDAGAFRVVVRNQDDYYGTVETSQDVVLKPEAQSIATYANDTTADNAVDDTATLTATPRTGYQVDHWEYLSGNDENGNIWTQIKNTYSSDPNVCEIKYSDFVENSENPTSSKDDIGSTIIVRAVYANSGSTNVRVMTDVQSTDADTVLQDAEVSVLTTGDDGKEKRLTGTGTMGGVAYDAVKSQAITLFVEYEPQDWTFNGWFAYTLDESGNRKVSDTLLSAEKSYTITPTANQYIMARLTPRTGALVYLDAAGGTTGSEAEDEAKLGVQRADDSSGKVYLPKLTRENRVFEGWSSNREGFPEGDSYVAASDGEVFTAMWGYEHVSVYTWAEEGGTTSGNIYDVPSGTQVTVNAYPENGWQFDHWLDYENSLEPSRVDGAGAEYTFTMGTETVRLCAVFVKIDPSNPGIEDKPSNTVQPSDDNNSTSEKQTDSAAQAAVIPRTADDFPLAIVIVLLVISAGGFAVVVLLRKRKK